MVVLHLTVMVLVRKISDMKNIFVLISIFMVLSCNKNEGSQNQFEILDGEIYFKLIDLNSLYNFEDDKIKKFKRTIDSIGKTKMNNNKKTYYKYYHFLFENDLIDKPMFLLKNEKNQNLRVFCDSNIYRTKIEPLIDRIDKSEKTIKISLQAIKIENEIYFCKQILDLGLINKKSIIKK